MTRAIDEALSWRVEEVCFNAFPPLRHVLFGNWILRFAPGISRRGNSANLLRPETGDLDRAIATAEGIYNGQGQPCLFRILSIADPALEAALDHRSYGREGETCVLYGPMDGLAAAEDRAVRLLLTPEERWLAAMSRLQEHDAARAETYRRIVEAIAVPARFALIELDGAVVALAFGALHDGLLCYESVVTDPARRRQGLARRIVASLAAWGREAGASGACLQVEAGNAPARALYERFGLSRELHRYHYRRQPTAP